MDKKILIKHIEGKTTVQEKKLLIEWMNQSAQNREYFSALKDMYILSSLPQQEATGEQMKIADSIIGRNKRTIFARIAYLSIAAAILIALCINIFLISVANNGKPDEQLNRQLLSTLPNDYLHTIYTNKGVKGEVALPDGSKIALNSDTKIIFPDKFSGSTREVYISGEAYFNVVTNPDTPMIVSTNRNFVVKVYGTEFNIRSYENEHNAKTTLFKGKIDLLTKGSTGEKLLAVLKPSELFELKDKERPVHVLKADTLKQGAWRHGNLLFDLTPMDQVIRDLERWHGAEFTVKDPSIYHLKFSASFKQESLVQILEIIKFCSNVDYMLDENKVTLFYKK
jgi:transmembrane sensor